jgi:DNA-binding NarL/FixJ family response regulator
MATASHDTHLLAPFLIKLSYVQYQFGRLIEAQRTAAEAQRIAARLRLDFPLHIATALEAAYSASIVQDGPGTRRAAALTESVLSQLGPRDSAWRTSSALWLADAAREFIDPGRWTTMASAVFGGPGLARVPTSLRPLGFELLAEASARAGRPDPEWADRAEAAASDPCAPLLRAHALAARAHVLTRSGTASAAADRYQEAARLFASAGMAGHQAHTLILAAPRLITAGRRPEGGSALDRAKEIAQASGSRSLLARVDKERRRLFAQRREPPREPFTPVAAPAPDTRLTALTDREHEVASLAGAGKRTREIAELLRLSPRTVDVHLTRIYRKLDLHSRAALARFMAQAG